MFCLFIAPRRAEGGAPLAVFYLTVLIAGIAIVPARAQQLQIPQSAIEQQQQILQQQRQKELEQQRKKRELQPPSKPKKKTTDDTSAQSGAAACVVIRAFEIMGAELFPAAEQALIKSKLGGRCLTVALMRDALRLITNWYVSAGYITTRAYLPEQDLSDGELTIRVVEGRIEDIAINENGRARRGVDTAFPMLEGRRLNIRDIEQGLDQIKRLRSFNPKIALKPGDAAGSSRVAVSTQRTLPVKAHVTYDNFGTPTTGEKQAGALVQYDDLLGLYDHLSVTLSQDSHQLTLDQDDLDIRSRSGSVFFSVPFGYWTASVYASAFQFATPITGFNQTFLSEGWTVSLTGEIERLIHRDQLSKTTVTAGLAAKQNKSFIEDAEIDVSSRRLAVGVIRASHARTLLGGSLSIEGSLERGLPKFGAEHDNGKNADEPRAQFTKVSANVRYTRRFQVFGQNLTFDTLAFGSAAPHNLFATERFSAGGRYSVRGFKGESISGDVGAYVRNELSWTLPPLDSPEATRLFGQAQLFAAFDAGWVRADDEVDPFERGHVSGAAAGLRITSGAVFGEAVIERALAAPEFLDPNAYEFHFRVGLSTDGLPQSLWR